MRAIIVLLGALFLVAAQDGGFGRRKKKEKKGRETKQVVPVEQAVEEEIVEKQVRKDLTYIASDALEGRMAGKPGADKAARYIAKVFKEAGLKFAPGLSSYHQYFKFAPRKSVRSSGKLGRGDWQTENVVGMFMGSDPKLKNECVVLGAHFDHIGKASDKENPGRIGGRLGNDEIFNGGNDNASGSTALVNIARALGSGRIKTRRSIILVAFGGEEQGLLGSFYYADHLPIPADRNFAMINMDSIGRMRDEKNGTVQVWQTSTSSAWESIMKPIADKAGVKCSFNRDRWPNGMSSDHVPFARKGIKSIGLFTGVVPERHMPNDEAERVDFKGLTQLARMVLMLAAHLCDRAEPLPD